MGVEVEMGMGVKVGMGMGVEVGMRMGVKVGLMIQSGQPQYQVGPCACVVWPCSP